MARSRKTVGNVTAARNRAPERSNEHLRIVARGHIVKLFIGQGHGVIRMADGRDIWFHRHDMNVDERAGFNDFVVGDAVAFHLLEDRISGARALCVRLH